jgi:outer membrane protein
MALHGPSVQQTEAQLTAARASVKSQVTSYFPTITASFSRGGNGFDSHFGWGDARYAYTYNLRFNLNYSLFDRLNREVGLVRARVAEDNAEASLRDSRLLAQQNLVTYLGSLRTAQQRVEIQLATVAAADENLRVQQQRYTLGASTLLELLNAQTTLNNARVALIQARFDARTAKAQIEALIGRDLQ